MRCFRATAVLAFAVASNDYYRGADRDEVIGGWGGTCTCPDGEIYWVGDNLDGCKSIACVGGVVGGCSPEIPPEARGMKAVCDGATPAPSTPSPTLQPPDPETLVWSDEFDYWYLDTSKWHYEEHPPRTFNDELQRYTSDPRNIAVREGNLVITARNDSGNITSGRLSTYGNFKFLYGRMQIRAKLPEGYAVWPAFWLLGADLAERPWPACGEIDLLEKMGHKNYHMACGAVHNDAHNFLWRPGPPDPLAYGCKVLNDLSLDARASGWHVWELHWTPDLIKMYIDSYAIFEYARGPNMTEYEWPYDRPFFLVVNLAICGAAFWFECGELLKSKALDDGVSLIVDYVRVYQDPPPPTLLLEADASLGLPGWKVWAGAFAILVAAGYVMRRVDRA